MGIALNNHKAKDYFVYLKNLQEASLDTLCWENNSSFNNIAMKLSGDAILNKSSAQIFKHISIKLRNLTMVCGE